MTTYEVEASAPGKILWLGGYAVTESPNVGFVTTIDQHVHVVLRRNPDDTVLVSAPQLVRDTIKGTVDLKTGKITLKGEANDLKMLHLLKTTMELGLMHALALGYPISGLDISTLNDSAFSYRVVSNGKHEKSGMGSSAAVTAATAGGVMDLFEEGPFITDIHKVAQLAHANATGRYGGSGFDIAAATYGSILYRRYNPELVKQLPPEDYTKTDVDRIVRQEWDYKLTPFAMPGSLHPVIANFVGEAAITAKLMTMVDAFGKKDPLEHKRLFADINAASLVALDELRKLRAGDEPNALQAFQEAVRVGRDTTKRLGELSEASVAPEKLNEFVTKSEKGGAIEPDELTELIAKSEKAGALIAKLPGAGGRDSIVALCRTESDATKLRAVWKTDQRLDVLNVKLQRRGLQVSRSTS